MSIKSAVHGMRAALVADGTLAAAVGTRIYLTQAAEGATLPYLLIDDAGGGSTNDTPRDAFDLFVQVKAVSGDGAAGLGSLTPGAQALGLADAIRGALHNAAITLESPWKLVDIQHEDHFYYVEDVDRRQYAHAGGTYRIRGTV